MMELSNVCPGARTGFNKWTSPSTSSSWSTSSSASLLPPTSSGSCLNFIPLLTTSPSHPPLSPSTWIEHGLVKKICFFLLVLVFKFQSSLQILKQLIDMFLGCNKVGNAECSKDKIYLEALLHIMNILDFQRHCIRAEISTKIHLFFQDFGFWEPYAWWQFRISFSTSIS